MFFPFHFSYFKAGMSGINEYLLTRNFVYSFLTPKNIVLNNQSISDILEEWHSSTEFDHLKSLYKNELNCFYNAIKGSNIQSLCLTPPQKAVFLSLLRVTFLPEYAKPENNFFVFNKKAGVVPQLCINYGTGFIKNTSNEVSVCVKLEEESRLLSQTPIKYDPKTENFNQKIEALLKTQIVDLQDIVAMCDMRGTTIKGVTVYRSTIIRTDPNYIQIWAYNNFIFIKEEGKNLMTYKPWNSEQEGKELVFKIGGREHRVLNFKTTEKIMVNWHHHGIRHGKYFFTGGNIKPLKLS